MLVLIGILLKFVRIPVRWKGILSFCTVKFKGRGGDPLSSLFFAGLEDLDLSPRSLTLNPKPAILGAGNPAGTQEELGVYCSRLQC